MILDQRRDSILEVIESKGFVSLSDLIEATGASESTVRRDLEFLDGIGQIRRTRGGAAYTGESLTTLDERKYRAAEQKQRIGRKAAELIQSGETIILDGGSTTLEVARHLNGKTLQVVTNSLPITTHLVGSGNIELMTLGGYLYPKTGVALGDITVAALKQIHARRLIMSVGGITEAGLFNSNSLLVETERQMIESADEVIVVADAEKFGHSELAHLAPLNVVDKLIVDAAITDEWKRIATDRGIEVIIAD